MMQVGVSPARQSKTNNLRVLKRQSLFCLSSSAGQNDNLSKLKTSGWRGQKSESLLRSNSLIKQIDSEWDHTLHNLIQKAPSKKLKKHSKRDINNNDYLLNYPVNHYTLRHTDNQQYCRDFANYIDGNISLQEFARRNNFPRTIAKQQQEYQKFKENNQKELDLENRRKSNNLLLVSKALHSAWSVRFDEATTDRSCSTRNTNHQSDLMNSFPSSPLNQSKSISISEETSRQSDEYGFLKNNQQQSKKSYPSIFVQYNLTANDTIDSTVLEDDRKQFSQRKCQTERNKDQFERKQLFTEGDDPGDAYQSSDDLQRGSNFDSYGLPKKDPQQTINFKSKGILKLRQFFKKRMQAKMQQNVLQHAEYLNKTLLFSTLKSIDDQTMLEVNHIKPKDKIQKFVNHSGSQREISNQQKSINIADNIICTPSSMRQEGKLQKFYIQKNFNSTANEYLLTCKETEITKKRTEQPEKGIGEQLRKSSHSYDSKLKSYISEDFLKQNEKDPMKLKMSVRIKDLFQLNQLIDHEGKHIHKLLQTVQIRRQIDKDNQSQKCINSNNNISPRLRNAPVSKMKQQQKQQPNFQRKSTSQVRNLGNASLSPAAERKKQAPRSSAAVFISSAAQNHLGSVLIDRHQKDDCFPEDKCLISSTEVKLDELYENHHKIQKYLKKRQEIGFVKKIKILMKLNETSENIIHANLRKLNKPKAKIHEPYNKEKQ